MTSPHPYFFPQRCKLKTPHLENWSTSVQRVVRKKIKQNNNKKKKANLKMITLKQRWSYRSSYVTTQMHNRKPQTRQVTTALTTRATPSDKNIRHNLTSPWERELTSCGDQVPVWNEEFIPIMLLQHVGEDLQGKTLLLPGLLAPLVRVHFGVGQVSVVVLVICGWREGDRHGDGWNIAPVMHRANQWGLLAET